MAYNYNQKLPKSLWKFYFKYAMRGHWPLMIGYAILFMCVMSDAVLFPNYQRWFIALFEQTPPAGVGFVEFALPTILFITGLFILWDMCLILRGMLHGRWQPIISNQISDVLNDFVQHQSMSFWTGRMAGKINSQINYVSTGFTVIMNFLEIFGSIAMILINVGLVLEINSYVALIFAAVFVFRLIYGLALMKPMSNSAKTASEENSSLSGKIVDSISNYSVVKLFAAADAEREYLKPARKKTITTRIYSFFIQRWFWGLPNFVWDIAFGLTMLLCVILFSKGNILVSEIVFTMSVFFNVMGMISRIIGQIPDVVEKLGSAKKSYDELNVELAVRDVENAPDLVVSHGKIEFKNVWFKYKRKWVLRDFNLTIKPGERVGLVGPSGAGKSTLVHLLMRFYDPTRGEILIDGQDIKTITQDSLRRSIAFIPQEPTLFNRTIRENIEYGKPGATDRQIRDASRRAAAHDFIMGTEKKYDSMVGDRGIKLSGGQKQRIAIARAFLKNAPILVLDEATSALDSETEIAIQKSFDELARGRTTVAIAHRLSTLRNMDKIVVLNNGVVVEYGTHNQLLRRRGEYWRLWTLQSGGFIQE